MLQVRDEIEEQDVGLRDLRRLDEHKQEDKPRRPEREPLEEHVLLGNKAL